MAIFDVNGQTPLEAVSPDLSSTNEPPKPDLNFLAPDKAAQSAMTQSAPLDLNFLAPDAAVQQLATDNPLIQARDLSEGMDPAKTAKVLQFSKKSGLPASVVEKHLPEIERREALNDGLLDDINTRFPGTTAFLSNPDYFAVAQDDIESLTLIEKAWNQAAGVASSAGKAVARFPFNVASSFNKSLALGLGGLDYLERQIGDVLGTGSSGLFKDARDLVLDINKPADDLLKERFLLPEEKRTRVWDAPSLLLDPEWWVYQVGEAIPSVGTTLLAAYASGGSTLVGGVVGGLQEAGNQYAGLIEDGVDPDAALSSAIVFGTAVSALEKVGLDNILSSKIANTFLKRVGKFLVAGGAESITEYAEEPIDALTSSIARGDDVDTIVGNVVESFKNVDVMAGAFITGGAFSAAHTRHEYNMAKVSEYEQQILDGLTGNIENSKLGKLDPLLFEEAMKHIKQGGELENIYIPAQAVAASYGEDFAGQSTVLEQLGVAYESYNNALASGGDLIIPLEKYATTVAQVPDFAARFINDRRLTPEGFTRNEKVKFDAEFSEHMQRAVDIIKEERAREDQFDQETQTIYDEVLSLRQGAGMVEQTATNDARTVAAAFTAFARMSEGQYTPKQLWDQYRPDVRRDGEVDPLADMEADYSPALDSLNQAAIPAQQGSGATQIATTASMYGRAIRAIKGAIPGAKSVLDYGAGLGLGADAMRQAAPDIRVDTLEVNTDRWASSTPPTYTASDQIGGQYDVVVSTNVLNVLEKSIRDAVLQDISSKIAPGGVALVTTRGWANDVANAKNFEPAEEERAIWVKRKTKEGEERVYQKGFDGNELMEYASTLLGDGFIISKVNSYGKSGIAIQRADSPSINPRKRGPLFQNDIATAGATNQVEAADAARLWAEMGTESPYFKRWFGESKVSRPGGVPIKMYHWTDAEFEQFDTSDKAMDFSIPNNRGDNIGTFFSSSPTNTKQFGANRVDAYLSLQNPKVFKTQEDFRAFLRENFRSEEETLDSPAKFYNDSRAVLEEQGYDGVIIEKAQFASKTSREMWAVAFSPTQIKSTSNRGTFDPQDPRISRQEQNAFVPPRVQPSGSTLTFEDTLKQSEIYRKFIKSLENNPVVKEAHKNRNLEFKAIPVHKVNSSGAIKRLIYKSPSHNRQQSSAYYLMMIGDRPAYVRVSNHWGAFFTNILEGDADAPADSTPDQFGRVGSRGYKWELIDGVRTKSGEYARTSQAGYIFLDELPNAQSRILRQVSPEEARSLPYKTQLPTDPLFAEAVNNTPSAQIVEDGLLLDLTRYQKEEQEGATSVRTGVFYLPTGSPQEKYYRGGKNNYGGKVRIQGETLIKRPLFVKGSTGGKAPEAAYDSIKGKGAYNKVRDDVLKTIGGWGKKQSEIVDGMQAILEKYEATEVDAYEIWQNSRQGNQLAYALQENIVAHAVREAGYDSVIGYSKKKSGGAFISEVFDVREQEYPYESGESGYVHDKYKTLFQSAFYSPLGRTVEGMDFKTIPAKDLINRVQKSPGIKAEELEDLGFIDWLKGLEGQKVSKEQVMKFIEDGGPKLEEVRKGESTGIDPESIDLFESEDPEGNAAYTLQLSDIDSIIGFSYDGAATFDMYMAGEYVKSLDQNSARQWIADTVAEEFPYVLSSTERSDTKYESYQLPGGENYREVLVTIPVNKGNPEKVKAIREKAYADFDAGLISREERNRRIDSANTYTGNAYSSYKSSHWTEPNVLAHYRLNDRTDAEGKSVLFIEEIQSDWHQEGRKKGYTKIPPHIYEENLSVSETEWKWIFKAPDGREIGADKADYATKGVYDARRDAANAMNSARARSIASGKVPNAPFKKSWNMLAFKRILREAVEQGYDRVAWTPGEMQAERYDLSKQVDSVEYYPKSGRLIAIDLEGEAQSMGDNIPPERLEDYIGKEAAAKLLAAPTKRGKQVLENADLKVGGEGMKGFYDKMLPSEVNKYVKKWGAKVGTLNLPGEEFQDTSDPTGNTRGQDFNTVWSLDITPEMRDAVMAGQPLYQAEQKPAGQIEFNTKSGTPLITLFETANEFTFLHETGHLYLEMLRSMALHPEAAPKIAQLWGEAKAALKIQDNGPITTEAHEEWARNLEAYFAKGEAPSLGLRKVFAKFAEWLRSVYKEVEKIFASSGTTFNPELKPIFDRLFATEAEIKDVEAYYEAQKPFFTLADQMAEEDRKKYDRLREKAVESTYDSRLRRLTAASVKAQGGRGTLTLEARSQVDAMPVYTAIEAIRQDGGLDMSAVDEIVGPEVRKKLARWNAVKKEGPLDPEIVAAQNGFDSAAEMLHAMAEAQTKNDAVNSIVEQRIADERAKIARGLLDEKSLPAEEAYHNEDRVSLLLAEFTLLADQTAKSAGAKARAIDTAAVREVARKTIRTYLVKDAMDYNRFARAERKAAVDARLAKEKGDTKTALEAKRRELLNHALFMESMQARKDVAKIEATMKKIASAKNMQEDSRELVQGLGIQYGVIPYKGLAGMKGWNAYVDHFAQNEKERPDLAAWAKSKEEYGAYFDPFVLSNTSPRNYKELTVEQFESVMNAVKTIRTIDRNERTITLDGERRAIEDVKKELAGTIQNREFKAPTRSGKNKFKKALGSVHAWHAKMETMLLDLDGWKHGPWWNTFFKPIADAENERNVRLKEVQGKLQETVKPVKKGLWKKVFVKEVNESFTRAELLSAALNMGNEGNLSRLKDGYGWSDAQIEAIKATLTKTEWDFVQNVWNFLDTFRPESFALQKEMTGREPERVTPNPVQTPYGVYDGGYYPIDYDADLSTKAFGRKQSELDSVLFGGRNYGSAQTKHGHLKDRAASGGGQGILLDLSVLSDHLYNTVHDLTHRRAVLDVAKLMRDGGVRSMVEGVLGVQAFREFFPWLQNVSKEYQQPMAYIHRLARWARKGTTVMQMGLKITTMVTQPLGITQTLDVLGAGYTMAGVKYIYQNPFTIVQKMQDIMDKSPFMAGRLQSFDREVRDATKVLSPTAGVLSEVQEFAFKGIGYMQMGVDLPTWWGAYQKGLAENEGNEAKAIAYADSIVRLSQGSGSIKDLARVQRGDDLFRLTTMFYSYFNTLYNLTYRRLSLSQGIKSIPTLAASALWLWFLPSILSELVAGRGPDDDEDKGKWLAQTVGLYPFQMIVGIRDLANAIGTEYDYQFSPAEAAPKSIHKWFKEVQKALEDREPEKLVKPTAEAVGFILQLPMKQVIISVGNVWDYMTGKDPEFKVRDLFYTKPKSRR